MMTIDDNESNEAKFQKHKYFVTIKLKIASQELLKPYHTKDRHKKRYP